jgi:squalene-hopene/tetraprenyl-beta-curcumene cyclase
MLRSTILVCVMMLGATAFAADVDAASASAAAKKAAEFLLKQQNDDGTFGKSQASPLPGMVGEVLKALAASPDKLRENNPQIEKSAKYLISKQQPNGSICIPQFGLENYNTSLAVLGLVGLENPAHKAALEKAKKFILNCQLDDEEGFNKDEHTRAFGAFGYGSSKRGDVSNTGFAMDALKELGFDPNSPEAKNVILFLKRSQDNEETNDAKEMKGGDSSGGFVYLPGDSEFGEYTSRSGKKLPKPYGNMTYQAVKSLIYAGMKQDDPAMTAAFKWIKNNYSAKENPGGKGMQGYYYYAIAFAKAFTAAGIKELELADGRKVNWAKDLATNLISLQKPDGSFVNEDKRWMESDAVLATSYALDALNLCIAAMK